MLKSLTNDTIRSDGSNKVPGTPHWASNLSVKVLRFIFFGVALTSASCTRGHPPTDVRVLVSPVAPSFGIAPTARPDDAPRIVRVWFSSDAVAEGDLIRGHVTTSSNVATVEVRLGPRSAYLTRTSFGQFRGSYRVPAFPSFLKRSYPVSLIARNANGVMAQVQVNITLH